MIAKIQEIARLCGALVQLGTIMVVLAIPSIGALALVLLLVDHILNS